jgi:hypothetical protein
MVTYFHIVVSLSWSSLKAKMIIVDAAGSATGHMKFDANEKLENEVLKINKTTT